jgi:CheY-like chemotaxis protein
MNKTNLNILYVEDNDETRDIVTNLLSKKFKKIHTATNGSDGFEKFISNYSSLDLVITDLRMPIVNGSEMISKIRKLNANIPIFVFSAYNEDKNTLELQNSNISKFYFKPSNVIEMMSDIIDFIKNQ